MRPNQLNKLLTRCIVGEKQTGKCARCCHRILLLNASHLHAHVGALQHHCNPLRVECFLNTITDFNRQTFLNLQTTGERIHYPRNFAQPNDCPIRNIGNVRFSKKKGNMWCSHIE